MQRVTPFLMVLTGILACAPTREVDAGTVMDSTVDAGPGAIYVARGCVPAPRLSLDAIPRNDALDDGDDETLAIFEVDGHRLIGKFVRDEAAAEIGLDLWREVATRIPENQLLDLVQLNIFAGTDPSANFNRGNDVTTERSGLRIGFSTINATINDPDPCAPLQGWRGTFDWSLIHEFGHLRGWLDESWFDFLETFRNFEGPGEGYPADERPILTGEFVTDYAETGDGDEDYAETWTAFVMLPESAIPPRTDDEPLALQKVRWVSEQPGLRELRRALRVSEDDGGDVTVTAAPRRTPR